jgi:hypothetical protein
MSYIIGSIHKVTGKRSISEIPVTHDNESDALAEATKLAKKVPENRFIVYKEVAIIESNEVTVTRL